MCSTMHGLWRLGRGPGGSTLRRCAFLTMTDSTGFTIDDDLAVGPLGDLGFQVESVPWQKSGVEWERYDVVVIRSTWDYFHDPDAFLSVLTEVESSGTRLENRVDLVRWNLRKTYLRDLAARGVATVPTLFRDRLEEGDTERIFHEVRSRDVVLKPVVSANAAGAFRLDGDGVRDRAREVEAYFSHREVMAQPLVRSVLEEGEYSLFYFNGEYSHAILKSPKTDDFRVQEEHGASIRRIVADSALGEAGRIALMALPTTPLYARVDLVRSDDGASYWVMELELIEPSMYLRMDPESPARFARALDERLS